jgi:hypothetical protein
MAEKSAQLCAAQSVGAESKRAESSFMAARPHAQGRTGVCADEQVRGWPY